MKSVEKRFDPMNDEKLPNGRHIVAMASGPGVYIWLAYCPNEYMKFATWVSNHSNPGATYWGHYYLEREEAKQDFFDRIALYKGEIVR